MMMFYTLVLQSKLNINLQLNKKKNDHKKNEVVYFFILNSHQRQEKTTIQTCQHYRKCVLTISASRHLHVRMGGSPVMKWGDDFPP